MKMQYKAKYIKEHITITNGYIHKDTSIYTHMLTKTN